MFSYRHAFHAGNHADVLKHTVLIAALEHLLEKETPLTVVDTHAGAGLYRLDGDYAGTSGEAADGVLRLLPETAPKPDEPALADALARYLAVVRDFNPKGGARIYPGSPFIIHHLLRDHDKLKLFELHPTDARTLGANIAQLEAGRRVAVLPEDGFGSATKFLPPPSRRALVLCDPSYEMKTDYAKVVAGVREALTRFADAVVIVWYPQILTLESSQLAHRLQGAADSLGKRGWLHVRLSAQQPDERGFGLVGSGLFIVNPPFSLHDNLNAVMPYLVDTLGQYDGANYLLEQRSV